MKVVHTEIEGLIIIEPTVYGDDRGYFFESFREDKFLTEVCNTHFVQDNEAKSNYGVLRGLHFQKDQFAQAKLVRVVKGAVLDVAVDLRKNSPTFGNHVAVELNEVNKLQFFVPRGFAHGYVVLQDNTVFNYKCDNYYAPRHEGGILWEDKTLKIDWKISRKDITISDKDSTLPEINHISELF